MSDNALQNKTEIVGPSTLLNLDNSASTAARPGGPDPTTTQPATSQKFHRPDAGSNSANSQDAAEAGLAATDASGSSQLASLKVKLNNNLRQYPNFPQPGILFEDIMPIFANHELHYDLITALELLICDVFKTKPGEKSEIDAVVGLESRGFLFGPTLALRLGAGFIPVRKAGKLPGDTVTEAYEKEYGIDHFEMQADAIAKGQKVLIVDDIIATGGSAAASGSLVKKVGGELLGYVFLKELAFLKGRDKLDAPVHTLLE